MVQKIHCQFFITHNQICGLLICSICQLLWILIFTLSWLFFIILSFVIWLLSQLGFRLRLFSFMLFPVLLWNSRLLSCQIPSLPAPVCFLSLLMASPVSDCLSRPDQPHLCLVILPLTTVFSAGLQLLILLFSFSITILWLYLGAKEKIRQVS